MPFKNELKNTFTLYWEYLALRTACQLDVFDDIENGYNTIQKLTDKNKADKKAFNALIFSLYDASTISEKNGYLSLTEKGKLLTANSPETLKQACILWGAEHLATWQHLLFTVKTGKPAFEHLFGMPFFDYIGNDKTKNKNYHLAMSEYARDDYENIAEYIDFSEFETIADVGGGTGTLIKNIAQKHPETNYILADLPAVCNWIESRTPNLEIIAADFFKPLPFRADAIILSRILHDWNDEKAAQILKNCSNALKTNGKLFVIEIMQNETQANLLTLNMMLMTASCERSYKHYASLLQQINFSIAQETKLNGLQTILTASKR